MKKVFIFITIFSLVGQFLISVLPAKAAYGTISANPSYFDGNSGEGPFTSYITWSSGGFDQVSGAVVYVSLNGGEETLFAYQNSCSGTSCPANWIYPAQTEQRYEFRLYEYNSFTGWVGDLLDKATVIVSPRQIQDQPSPRTCNGNPSLNISPSSISFEKNQTYQFRVFYDPDGANCPNPDQDVTYQADWFSYNSSIVQLVGQGLFKGIASGTTQIRATYNNLQAYANLTIIDNTPVYNPILSINKTQFYLNDSWQLNLVGAPPNQPTYICAIDNRGGRSCTPTVNLGLPSHTDSSGNWRASGNWIKNGQPDESVLGTWTEWMYVGGTLSGGQVNGGVRSNDITFTIIRPPSTCQGNPTLVINPSNASINVGQDVSFRALYDLDGPSCPQAEQNVTGQATWQSANNSVAQLVNPGVFRGLDAGTVQIRAIYNNIQAYATINILRTTSTPNQAPIVQTLQATGITQNSATLNGKVNPQGSQTQYRFEYGTSQSLGNFTSWQLISPSNSDWNVFAQISGLSPNTTYYFRIIAQNQYGTTQGQILSFTTDFILQGNAPQAFTDPASAITYNSAILNGRVNPNGSPTSYYFEYGPNSNFGFTTPFQSAGSGNTQNFVSAYITGLNPNTSYYYRLVAQNSYGISYGETRTFMTNFYSGYGGFLGNVPQVITQQASNIFQSSATLNAQINPNNADTQGWFEYGTNPNYLPYTTSYSNIGSGNYYYNFSQTVYNLLPNTNYYFRAVARNQYGINYGQILNFYSGTGSSINLPSGSQPIVRTEPATYISQNSALLNGKVNPNGGLTSAWIEYGPNTSLGIRTTILPMGSSNMELPYSFAVSGLLPNTIYYFRIVAQNQYGISYGQTLSFMTLPVQTTIYTSPSSPQTQVVVYPTTPTTRATSFQNNYGRQIDCLTIIPSINGKALNPGEEFTYITTIKNNCEFTLENSILRVVLPQETDFISTSFSVYSLENNTVILNLGKIDANVQTAVNILGRIKSNAKNGDHLIFTSILSFNYRNFAYMLNAYLTAVVGQKISGEGFAAAIKTIGGIFTNWIFWLIVILIVIIWIIYILISRRGDKEENEKNYDLSGLKVNREIQN